MAFPMARDIEWRELIARYPVDQWHDRGQPYFAAKSRCRLAMRVAKQDLCNLKRVFETAQVLLPKCPEDAARSDGAEALAESAEPSCAPSGASSSAGQS